MSIDFVAIDFETASYFRGSPCAVVLTTVRDGHIIDIMLDIAARQSSADLTSLAETLGLRPGFIGTDEWQGCTVP